MRDALKAMPCYESYKDSGVEWLGEIPVHWELTRLGTRFIERREKVSDKDYPPLSVTKSGILPQLETAAKTNDGDNRKLVKSGDFVINSRSDRKGSSGVSDRDGSVSLINIVLKPKRIHHGYCNYLLKSYAFVEEFYRMGHGIVADLWTTRYDEMRAVTLGVPSIEEQTAIANYLDRKTAQIDQAVAIKEQQIALLKERKQILIQHAVTRGLNPHAPLRDSGVEWIGEIPAHWVKTRVRIVLNRLEQGDSPSASNSDTGRHVLKLSAIKEGKYILGETKPIAISAYQTRFQVSQGDFLLTRGNTPELVADSCVVVGMPDENTMFSDLVYRLSFNLKKVELMYMLYTFQSRYFRTQIINSARGSSGTMVKVSQEHIKSWEFMLPPKEEQTAIVTHIETQSAKIDRAIALQQQQIDRLKEYKATLINSAVTGKIRVPGVPSTGSGAKGKEVAA